MPRRLPILALGLLIAAAALSACDGGQDPEAVNLIPIARYEPDHELTIEELFDPPFASEYPDIVAEVNGEPITGNMLAKMVAANLSARQQKDEFLRQFTSAWMLTAVRFGEQEDDPLESVIDQTLLFQAARREGFVPSNEEAVAYTREVQRQFLDSGFADTPEEREALMATLDEIGVPDGDWGSDPELVEGYGLTLAIAALREAECSRTVITPGVVNLGVSSDCGDFLRQERERADIVYYVRWAD